MTKNGVLARRLLVALLIGMVGMLAPRQVLGMPAITNAPSSPGSSTNNAPPLSRYDHLPISFEINQGQTNRSVRFLAHGPGYTLFLTPSSAVLSLRAATPAARPDIFSRDQAGPGLPARVAPPPTVRTAALAFQFLHANPHPRIVGLDPLPGRVNYFIGNDPHLWRTNIRTYARVEYRNLYPGIDLVYYGRHGHLEYDWLVHPHADISRIDLGVRGARGLTLSRGGALLIRTPAGTVRSPGPLAWQRLLQGRSAVQSRYRLGSGHQVELQVTGVRHDRLLDVDPSLIYSTYLGGSNYDGGAGIAADSTGNAYVAGYTQSTDFPTVNAYQSTDPSPAHEYVSFVTKLAPSGMSLLYSTYLGGSNNTYATSIAVDSSGSAYVAGYTQSTDFPTENPVQAQNPDNVDGFITKLAPSGSLTYSTYLGGTTAETTEVYGIAVDDAGDAYVTGETASSTFLTKAAVQAQNAGGFDAFVSELAPSGSSLVYSTYLGGSNNDSAGGIAIDTAGDAYVTGYTSSPNFPTQNPYQPTCHACVPNSDDAYDAFVTEIESGGTSLVYSTFLGGTGNSQGNAIAVDRFGEAYVAGQTDAGDFPVKNAFESTNTPAFPAGFVTKLAASGSALIYSTFLGDSTDADVHGIAVDASGAAYLAGQTDASNFPTLDPYQGSNTFSNWAGFVTKLAPSGSALLYSTYLGGSTSNSAESLAIDGAGAAYVAGWTSSPDFPIQNAYQSTYAGGNTDAFVAKFQVTTPTFPVSSGWNLLDLPLANMGLTTMSALSQDLDASLGPDAIPMLATYQNGRYSVYVPGYAADGAVGASSGILVRSTTSGVWEPPGQPYTNADNPTITLEPGWNLVGAAYPATGFATSRVYTEVGLACGLQEIATYGPAGYTTWTFGSAHDMAIPSSSGFWMECTKSAVWTPY